MLRMRAVAVILALLSPAVLGLGLGSLKTKSALNEPFLGRIEIVDASAQDFDAMTARLADAAQFQRAGVARDAVLLNLRFEVVSSESGADYIKITTKDPVREPFLNFLLELNWAKGRLVREYTVLLDPPLYDRNKVNRPSIAAPAAPMPKLNVPAVPSVSTAAPTPAKPAGAPTVDDTIGPVQARDTAWGLALAHRPDSSISVQRMMLALLRTNPAAFANNNVNVLRRGAILRMPSTAEIQGISQAEAIAEIKHQHEVWAGYREAATKHVEEAPVSAPEPSPQPSSPLSAEPTPSAPGESAPKPDAHLELAAPETKTPEPPTTESPNPTGTGSENKSSTDTSALTNEALDAKTRESAELQSKLTEAEQIIDLLQRQVKIKDDELAKLQSKVTTPSPAAEPPSSSAPKPESSKPAPAPTVAPMPEEDNGLLSRLTGFIPAQLRDAVPGGAMTILGILASLLVLIVLGVVRAANNGGKAIVASAPKTPVVAAAATAVAAAAKAAPSVQDQMLSTAQDVPAYDPSGDQEQFMRTMEASADQLSGAPQEDPLEEVNVYLAYERFDQAEELVKQVIAEYPNEPKYKLRLLEIYYSANNKRAYENAARELHDAVGDHSPLWESAVAMWNEMSPGRALFAPGADSEPESSVAMAGAKSFVDITSATAATTLTLAPGGDPLASTVVSPTDDIDSGGLDFDLSETTAQVTSAPSVLDITAGEGPEDGMLDLTATAEDGGISRLADTNSTLATTQSNTGDVFDISGGLPDTLELDPDGTAQDVDLLDVTDAGDGLSLGDVGLLDVTSPRSERTISTDVAEAITVNALDNRGDLDEFDLGDTIAPAAKGTTSDDELDFDIAALERSVQQASGSELDDLDLTLDSESDVSGANAAKADLELSLNSLSQFDLDSATGADAGSGGSEESDVEFDLALQDTTDFENLAINDTLEIPRSVMSKRGMQAVDTPSESLEDLTRSMEASIAGLNLNDIHGDDDSILDLALEPDSDSIDLDFGLDDGLGLNELDTLALDPGELRKAESTISERTVSMSRDGTSNDLQATLDETDTKLNLAKAYIELGDHDGARSILNEVVADGQTEQQDEARKLLSQLT